MTTRGDKLATTLLGDLSGISVSSRLMGRQGLPENPVINDPGCRVSRFFPPLRRQLTHVSAWPCLTQRVHGFCSSQRTLLRRQLAHDSEMVMRRRLPAVAGSSRTKSDGHAREPASRPHSAQDAALFARMHRRQGFSSEHLDFARLHAAHA